jgi:hypothetical protein
MKKVYLIFYGKDGDAAKKHAIKIRAEKCTAMLRHTDAFDGEAEQCDSVIILPDVSDYDTTRIRAAYGDKVSEPTKTPAADLPPIVPIERVPSIVPPPPAPPAVPVPPVSE